MITKTNYQIKVPTDELHKIRYWVNEALGKLSGEDGSYSNEISYNLQSIRDSLTVKLTNDVRIIKETQND